VFSLPFPFSFVGFFASPSEELEEEDGEEDDEEEDPSSISFFRSSIILSAISTIILKVGRFDCSESTHLQRSSQRPLGVSFGTLALNDFSSKANRLPNFRFGGGFLARSSQRSIPNENTSAGFSMVSPIATSGAIQRLIWITFLEGLNIIPKSLNLT